MEAIVSRSSSKLSGYLKGSEFSRFYGQCSPVFTTSHVSWEQGLRLPGNSPKDFCAYIWAAIADWPGEMAQWDFQRSVLGEERRDCKPLSPTSSCYLFLSSPVVAHCPSFFLPIVHLIEESDLSPHWFVISLLLSYFCIVHFNSWFKSMFFSGFCGFSAFI